MNETIVLEIHLKDALKALSNITEPFKDMTGSEILAHYDQLEDGSLLLDDCIYAIADFIDEVNGQ